MPATDQDRTLPETAAVEAVLNYAVEDAVMPVTVTPEFGGRDGNVAGTIVSHTVKIHDARPVKDLFTLDDNGFVLITHETAVTDFYEDDQIRRVYYPEMIDVVRTRSGSRRVVVFDHTVRHGDDGERAVRKLREPVQRVHNDYTEWSAPQRVRDIMGAEAEALLERRFAVIQVWRPINRPVEREPLAFADGRSVPFEDYVIAERRYANRVGQTYRVKYGPGHRWYYLPDMRPDEALVFKVYDSARDGRVRFTAHSAFDDPTSAADARPRESIEIRTLAFF
ncbi:MAG: CmcJ/NvfI family oxidoreductase [Hyphomicrobiaceae bacterium]